MQIKTFSSYNNYVKAQRRANRRKSSKSHHPANEIAQIVTWHTNREGYAPTGISVVCHGCGSGTEIDEFKQSLFPQDTVVGTDLFPQREDIIEHDFHNPISWGLDTKPTTDVSPRYDIVYSNSLDHSDRPRECLKTWLDQLKPGGYLFVEWSASHLTVDGGDCFGAALHEYMWLIAEAGTFVDFIYCGDTVVLVGQK